MSSPSALTKVNYLVIRHLHFWSMRGDLQEGHDYASRCQSPLFSSTKSAFLCSSRGISGIGKRKSDLRANHRARFKNSNALKPRFPERTSNSIPQTRASQLHVSAELTFPSTKSRFLCSIRGTSGIGKRKSNLPAIHRAYFQNANA